MILPVAPFIPTKNLEDEILDDSTKKRIDETSKYTISIFHENFNFSRKFQFFTNISTFGKFFYFLTNIPIFDENVNFLTNVLILEENLFFFN